MKVTSLLEIIRSLDLPKDISRRLQQFFKKPLEMIDSITDSDLKTIQQSVAKSKNKWVVSSITNFVETVLIMQNNITVLPKRRETIVERSFTQMEMLELDSRL